jgi:hypothetical protein
MSFLLASKIVPTAITPVAAVHFKNFIGPPDEPGEASSRALHPYR